jgi:hypothetical protein
VAEPTGITVAPDPFTIVDFDRDEIISLAARARAAAGLPDGLPLHIAVDEMTPLGRTTITSLDPLTIEVESGAFEDAKRLRQLNPDNVLDVLGRLLHRVRDRRDAGFADAPAEDDLTADQRAAWDTYCTGRAGRAGLPVQEQRWRYIFRNRHGFTDTADSAFERIWHGEGLVWGELQAICDATAADRESPGLPAR